MADEPIQPVVPGPDATVAPVAPVADVAVSPVAVAAEPIPAADAVAAGSEPAAAAEPVKEALPTDAPTLLEQFDKDTAAAKDPVEGEKPAVEVKEGEKPADVEKPAAEAKTEEAKAVEPAVEAKPVEPEPIKFEYKLPEGVVLPEAQQTELNEAFTNFARNPGSAEAQQKLVDFHQARLSEVADAATRYQHQKFADVRTRWVNEIKNHPILGGGNHEAAKQAVAHVRNNFVSLEPPGSKSYERSMARFNEFLHYTGAGDHPAFWEFVHNISTVLNESQGETPPDIKLIPEKPNNGGLAPIYKAPSSFRNGR